MSDLEPALEAIESIQHQLERDVEWVLTESLPYEDVRRKVVAAQVALNGLYVYIMDQQKELSI
jgi:hypothetical protein